MRAVVDAGICVRGLQIDYDEEVEHAGIQKLYDLARFNRDNPFMMWISFTHPHSPYITTQHYWDKYNHDDVEMPSVPAFSLDDMDPMSRWLHYAHAGDLHNVTDDNIRTARHAYYGMCSYIDDKVGRILDTIEHLGIEQETIVVFTSDHGEMLGERGMWFKQSFYEWSSTVPLIIKIPGLNNRPRAPELTSLVDLLPTFVDIATDGKPPEPVSQLDGNSLLPLMQGDNADWDNKVASEYTGEGVIAPCRMVRRDNIKFIYTHGHPDLMYDLDKDPLELNNLSGNADNTEVEESLKAELLDGWDPAQINNACIQSQKERTFIQNTTDGNPNWAYCAREGDSERFIRNASAVGTKAKARYPFVEPTPFIK
jgi:choline-sulfatase